MPFFRSKTSSPAQTSLIYLTVGCLMIVWMGVWYIYLINHPPQTPAVYYWLSGFTLTGLTLVVIGLAVGQIGRAARHAQAADVIAPDAPAGTNQAAPVATAVPNTMPPVSPGTVPPSDNTFASTGTNRSPAIHGPR